MAYKKDSTAVRDLRVGDGVSRALEKNFNKLDVDINGVGNYDAAIIEMSERKSSKVNFGNANYRETFEGGPDRVTTGTWGVYVAGKEQMDKIGCKDSVTDNRQEFLKILCRFLLI